MTAVIDLSGHTFGLWAVQGYAGKLGVKHAWLCRCQCGRERAVTSNNLRGGRSLGCGHKGCRPMYCKHGLQTDGKQTPEYKIWAAMKGRCTNPADTEYNNYGGRGIKVCARWANDAGAFVADMGLRPSPKHSLDREDNDGDYEPSNCRWATVAEQANNRRSNVRLTLNGRTQTIAQWCRELGLKSSLVESRIARGWSDVDALTLPRLEPGERYRGAPLG